MRVSGKLIIIGVIVVVLGGYGVTRLFEKPSYIMATVVHEPIQEEVLASGHVESPTTADLSFKATGKMTRLYAKVGQHVATGDILAQQDASVLEASLAQARANVAAAQAGLNKILAGATTQTVDVSKASLSSAELALANAYASAATTMDDAQAKANDAIVNQLARFFIDGQTSNPKLSFSVGDFALATRIVAERASANTILAAWQPGAITDTMAHADIDAALATADTRLGTLVTLANDAVSAVAANSGLSTTDATTYRTAAATGLSELNTARSNIETLTHTIATNKAAVASAQASLNLTTASSTQNDIDAQQAAVAAAQANVASIAAQIRDLEIIAPFAGVVTNTTGAAGQVMGPNTTVVSLMPDAKLQVKVNVSEDNIVKVALGDRARIELDAFPASAAFPGVVRAIDPAETLVGGAVYYQTTLLFDALQPGIRSGMTANTWIETASSTDALVVPVAALATQGATTTVQVLVHGVPEVRTVTVGIKSQDGKAEILSGLSAGDEVVTGS